MSAHITTALSLSLILLLGAAPNTLAATSSAKHIAKAEKALSSGDAKTAAMEAARGASRGNSAQAAALAARAFFLLEDFESAAGYLAQAQALRNKGDGGGKRHLSALKAQVTQSARALGPRLMTCPPTLPEDVLTLLEWSDYEAMASTRARFEARRTCFVASFPELPGSLTVTQDGLVVPGNQASGHSVLPGSATITVAGHPPFQLELKGPPGSLVEVRPRGEAWMQASLSLSHLPPEATVEVDGEVTELSPESVLRLGPLTTHEVLIQAPGRVDFDESVQLAFGEEKQLDVRMDRTRAKWPMILLGAGVAALAGGSVYLGQASGIEADYRAQRVTDDAGTVLTLTEDDAMARQDEANSAQGMGIALVTAGLSAAAIGAVWRWMLEDTSAPEWR